MHGGRRWTVELEGGWKSKFEQRSAWRRAEEGLGFRGIRGVDDRTSEKRGLKQQGRWGGVGRCWERLQGHTHLEIEGPPSKSAHCDRGCLLLGSCNPARTSAHLKKEKPHPG